MLEVIGWGVAVSIDFVAEGGFCGGICVETLYHEEVWTRKVNINNDSGDDIGAEKLTRHSVRSWERSMWL